MVKNKVYYIHIVIYLVLTFGIGILPPFGEITELGMRVLGVFIGTIYGWITLSLSWPSFFSMIALSLVGYTTITESFCSGLGYYLVPILIVTFIFATAVNKTGITEYLTEWLMCRKIIVGHPYMFMIVLFLGMEILSILNTSFVGLMMIWSMVVSLSEKAGLEKNNPFTTFMVPSLIVIFVIFGFILPFHSGSVMYIGFFMKGMGMPMPDIPYMIWQLVIVNLYIVILLIVAKFVIRLDLSKIVIALESYKDKKCPQINHNQMFGLAILLTFLVVLLSPSFLPEDSIIGGKIKSMGILGVATILTVILLIRKNADGTVFITTQEAAKGISWDVIWLIVATTPLAAAFEAEECGIMSTIMGFLTPLLTDMSPTLFIVVCTITLGIVTQFVHNLILAIVFIPILCPLCAQMGGNPYACFFAIFFALTFAFATPAASMNAALIFGHEAIRAKDGYMQGIMHLVISLVLVLIVGIPLANLLF